MRFAFTLATRPNMARPAAAAQSGTGQLARNVQYRTSQPGTPAIQEFHLLSPDRQQAEFVMTRQAITDSGAQSGRESARIPGLVLIASGIAMVVLLALHPEGATKDFAGVLRNEAANRGLDAFVHGGFVIILAIQMACYAIFSLRLSRAVHAGVAGLVFFCFGAAMLSGSTLIDGLALPAIAAKYVGVPARIESARLLYVFGGTLISILMPLGIGFQSAGFVAWSVGLSLARQRKASVAGFAVGLSILASVAIATKYPVALMAGIAGLALWAIIAGAAMTGSAEPIDA